MLSRDLFSTLSTLGQSPFYAHINFHVTTGVGCVVILLCLLSCRSVVPKWALFRLFNAKMFILLEFTVDVEVDGGIMGDKNVHSIY